MKSLVWAGAFAIFNAATSVVNAVISVACAEISVACAELSVVSVTTSVVNAATIFFERGDSLLSSEVGDDFGCAWFELGRACGFIGDGYDSKRYYKRAKEGYEEQLGRESEKALEATVSLIINTCSSGEDLIEKMRDLVKRCEKALGKENEVTLTTLNDLGSELIKKEKYEEAKEVFERCLAGRMKVLGKDHQNTLMALQNLGAVYEKLKNYDKALE